MKGWRKGGVGEEEREATEKEEEEREAKEKEEKESSQERGGEEMETE